MGDPTEERILNGLRSSSKGLTRTEITGLLGGHTAKKVISPALKTLQDQGVAHHKSVKTKGRPEERWFLQEKDSVKEGAKKEKKAK
jgi:predicted ArsR family transcriptional regulator